MTTTARKQSKPKPKPVWTLNLWTLVGQPSPKREWSEDQKLAIAKEAGFDAIHTYADASWKPKLEKHGLRLMGFFVSSKASEFKDRIQRQIAGGAEHINVHLGDHNTPIEKAVDLAVRLIDEGNKHDIPIYIETHRNTCTETPEKLEALAEGFEKATGSPLPICWDHSHHHVVKIIDPHDFSKRYTKHKKPLQRTPLWHFRPSNGNHCQIPVTDGKGKLSIEFKAWLPFAEELMEIWLKGPRPTNEMWVCPELGPNKDYGNSLFPNVWEDNKRLRKELAKAWNRALKKTG